MILLLLPLLLFLLVLGLVCLFLRLLLHFPHFHLLIIETRIIAQDYLPIDSIFGLSIFRLLSIPFSCESSASKTAFKHDYS